jgi:dUTPase
MAVFSDGTIRKRLAALVTSGSPLGARHCAYEFTAAVLFKGASAEPRPIDPGNPIVIEPTELVWIKAREEIRMPANAVGLWVQTQTLSRQGLLLLNTTLIEPGYEGPLHAVFVNFGNKKVVIDAGTKIAKVLFLGLDQPADELLSFDVSGYDRSILDISSNSPVSFMRLESLVSDQKKELERAGEDVKQQIVKDAKEELQKGIRWSAVKWLGGAAVGFVAGLFAVYLGMTVYLPKLTASYAEVDALASKVIQTRAAGWDKAVSESQAEMERLKKEIEDLKRAGTGTKKIGPGSGRSP